MIAIAVIAIAGTAFLIVSAPRFMGGEPDGGVSPWRYAHLVVAGVGIIVGLALDDPHLPCRPRARPARLAISVEALALAPDDEPRERA